ncbi:MAG: hypothetical protein H5U40_01950, partial [Polyangiaceae bacterium]|nr:hypothetical protein [Polyangiaceae bacterium]
MPEAIGLATTSPERGLVERVGVDPASALGRARAALGARAHAEARAVAEEALETSDAPAERDALAFIAGRAAAAIGDANAAVAHFDRVIQAHGPLEDWAALARAELLRTIDPARAAAEATRLAAKGFAGAARARRVAALALLDAERFEEATRLLRAELEAHEDRSAGAAVAMPLADHLASRDDHASREEALALYRRVATRAPSAELGRRASAKAEAVLASLPHSRRAALSELADADRMAEARGHYDAMRHQAARNAYRAIARTTTDVAVRCEARLMEGSALERARERREAAPILSEVAERCADPEIRATALYRAGRSLQAVGERDAALERYLALPASVPGHRLADDGYFLAARLLDAQGETARARELLERLIREL